jgi:hypothetical protein
MIGEGERVRVTEGEMMERGREESRVHLSN